MANVGKSIYDDPEWRRSTTRKLKEKVLSKDLEMVKFYLDYERIWILKKHSSNLTVETLGKSQVDLEIERENKVGKDFDFLRMRGRDWGWYGRIQF